MDNLTNRKRLLYETNEDIYFYIYNILLILHTLDCKSEDTSFQDYRKIAFIIDIISNEDSFQLFIKYYGGKQEINNDIKRKLQNIYYEGIEKIKFLRYVLLIMEKNNFIVIEKKDNKVNIFLIEENNKKEFFENKRFTEVVNHIRSIPRIKTLVKVSYKTFIKNIFKENGVAIWED